MSFLNSLLSSIGGREHGNTPLAPSTTSQPAQTAGAKATVFATSSTAHAVRAPIPDLKRKAEPSPSDAPAKVQRTESYTLASHLKPVAKPATTSLQARPPHKTAILNVNSEASNSEPGPPTIRSVIPTSIPANKSTTPRISTTTIKPPLSQSLAPATSTTSPAKAAPKGSYQAILERAQAAKAKQTEAGTVKHKATAAAPKLSKRERLVQEAQAAEKARLDVRQGKPAKPDGRPVLSAKNLGKTALDPRERKKQPVDLGYKGTMRPAPSAPGYKGTAKTGPPSATSSRIPERSVPKRPPDRISGSRYTYASYSDEEEDEEQDEEDEESDMEGGFDDMEEEEEQALRIAKQEDERALREEAEHKRLKAEKRKKLEQLAASRRR